MIENRPNTKAAQPSAGQAGSASPETGGPEKEYTWSLGPELARLLFVECQLDVKPRVAHFIPDSSKVLLGAGRGIASFDLQQLASSDSLKLKDGQIGNLWSGDVCASALSRNARSVFMGSTAGEVKQFSLAPGIDGDERLLQSFRFRSGISALSTLDDGGVVAGDAEGTIYRIGPDLSKPPQVMCTLSYPALFLRPLGGIILAASSTEASTINTDASGRWEVSPFLLPGLDYKYTAAAMSCTGNKIAFVESDRDKTCFQGGLYHFERDRLSQIGTFEGPGDITALSFGARGSIMASGSSGPTVYMYSTEQTIPGSRRLQPRALAVLDTGDYAVNSICSSPDGRLMMVTSEDHKIRVFHARAADKL